MIAPGENKHGLTNFGEFEIWLGSMGFKKVTHTNYVRMTARQQKKFYYRMEVDGQTYVVVGHSGRAFRFNGKGRLLGMT